MAVPAVAPPRFHVNSVDALERLNSEINGGRQLVVIEVSVDIVDQILDKLIVWASVRDDPANLRVIFTLNHVAPMRHVIDLLLTDDTPLCRDWLVDDHLSDLVARCPDELFDRLLDQPETRDIVVERLAEEQGYEQMVAGLRGL